MTFREMTRSMAEASAMYVGAKHGITEPCSPKWVTLISDDGEDSGDACAALSIRHCTERSDDVLALLEHPHAEVRLMAARVLGSIGNDRAAQVLKQTVCDEDDTLASEAMTSWSRLSADDCKSYLAQIALRGNPLGCTADLSRNRLRRSAIYAAKRVGFSFELRDVRELLGGELSIARELLKTVDCGEVTADVEIRERVMAFAEEALDSTKSHSGAPYAALEALARCRVSAAEDRLLAVLARSEISRRWDEDTQELVEAIGACGGDRAALALARLVLAHPPIPEDVPSGDGIASRGQAALRAIEAIGGIASLPVFREGLRDPSFGSQAGALYAVERLNLKCHVQPELDLLVKTSEFNSLRERARNLTSLESLRECAKERLEEGPKKPTSR